MFNIKLVYLYNKLILLIKLLVFSHGIIRSTEKI